MPNSRTFQFITALTAWFALALQLYILVNNTPENGLTALQAIARFFVFFTILTNLLVAVSLSISLWKPGSPPGRFLSKSSSLAATGVYIFIVGLTYNILLRNLWKPEGLQKLADELLHVVVPLLYIIYWFIYAPKKAVGWSHAFTWLIYPALYLAYALLRGGMEGFYPYFFIDVRQLGISRVLLNSAGMLVLFVLTGLLFVYIAKMRSGSNSGT